MLCSGTVFGARWGHDSFQQKWLGQWTMVPRGHPRDVRTKFPHPFGDLSVGIFCNCSDWSQKRIWIPFGFRSNSMRLGRSMAKAHMQSVRACEVETQFSNFCFFQMATKIVPYRGHVVGLEKQCHPSGYRTRLSICGPPWQAPARMREFTTRNNGARTNFRKCCSTLCLSAKILSDVVSIAYFLNMCSRKEPSSTILGSNLRNGNLENVVSRCVRVCVCVHFCFCFAKVKRCLPITQLLRNIIWSVLAVLELCEAFQHFPKWHNQGNCNCVV